MGNAFAHLATQVCRATDQEIEVEKVLRSLTIQRRQSLLTGPDRAQRRAKLDRRRQAGQLLRLIITA